MKNIGVILWNMRYIRHIFIFLKTTNERTTTFRHHKQISSSNNSSSSYIFFEISIFLRSVINSFLDFFLVSSLVSLHPGSVSLKRSARERRCVSLPTWNYLRKTHERRYCTSILILILNTMLQPK